MQNFSQTVVYPSYHQHVPVISEKKQLLCQLIFSSSAKWASKHISCLDLMF